MLKKRYWLILLMVIVSLIVIYIFWSTLQQAIVIPKNDNKNNSKVSNGSDEFIGMKIKIPGAEKNGFWELNIKKLESLNEVGNLSYIDGNYFINTKPVYQLTGNKGVIYWKEKKFAVKGNVVLKTIDNSKILTAGEMIWDPRQGITIQHQAVLKTDNLLVTADAIHSNLELSQVSFSGLTKVVYQRPVTNAN